MTNKDAAYYRNREWNRHIEEQWNPQPDWRRPPEGEEYMVIDVEDELIDGVIVDADLYENWRDDLYAEAETFGYEIVDDGNVIEFYDENGLIDQFEFQDELEMRKAGL